MFGGSGGLVYGNGFVNVIPYLDLRGLSDHVCVCDGITRLIIAGKREVEKALCCVANTWNINFVELRLR